MRKRHTGKETESEIDRTVENCERLFDITNEKERKRDKERSW